MTRAPSPIVLAAIAAAYAALQNADPPARTARGDAPSRWARAARVDADAWSVSDAATSRWATAGRNHG